MRLFLIVFSIVFISACNSETQPKPQEAMPAAEQNSESGKDTSASEPKAESHDGHDHHGHNHEQPSASALTQGYEEVDVQDSCETPTVIEFFAYQCPHCYKLEEHAKAWKKSKADDVNFIMVPTDLGREQFTVFVVSHYIAERLGVLDQIKPKLFAIIHEQKQINNILQLFTEAGLNEDDVKKAFEDTEKTRQALVDGFELMKRYKIAGVPKLLVNYQYQIDVTSAGGYDKVFDVVNDTLKLNAKCRTL